MLNYCFLLYIFVNFTRALPENCHKSTKDVKNCTINANYFHESDLDKPMRVSMRCHELPKNINIKRFSGVTRIEWNGCHSHTQADAGFYLNNFLKDPDPASVVNLTVEAFEVQKISSNEFDELNSLKYLTLYGNNISEADENFLETLPKLEFLELYDNHLLNSTFLRYGHKRIEELRITEKTLYMKDPLKNFAKLRKVRLRVQSIRNEVLEHLPLTLGSLEIRDTVIMDGNNVKMTEIHLNNPENLENVTLTGLQLSRLLLKSCKSIKVLDLSHNRLKLLNFSCSFRSLDTLKLDSNSIGSVNQIQLQRFPKLEELYLRDNYLHKLDLRVFEVTKLLRTVKVSNNFLKTIDFNENLNKNMTIPYKIFVDENPLDCTWLLHIKISFRMKHLIYTPNKNGMNVDGLQCSYKDTHGLEVVHVQEPFVILISPYAVIFLIIYLLFSVTIFLMQTIGYCYQSYLLHKQRHIPFYRTLGIIDNPRGDRRETIQMTMRPLPSLNYEQPIWERYRYSASSISSVPMNEGSVYEEIAEAKSGKASNEHDDYDLFKELQNVLELKELK